MYPARTPAPPEPHRVPHGPAPASGQDAAPAAAPDPAPAAEGPPPPARVRRSRRISAAVAGTVALGALVTLGAVTGTGGHGPVSPQSPSLAWPAEGQTSIHVAGLGVRNAPGPRGAQKPVPLASVTKVMTAYVVLRDHPIPPGGTGSRITVDARAAQDSSLGAESTVAVEAGRRLSERQVLELLLLPSAGNIARMLARWDAGTEEAFVAKMNRAAHDLGMANTTYRDSSGIDPATVSTSQDQLKLARKVMWDAAFRSVVAEREAHVPGSPPVHNTNTLLGEDGVIGVKTGSSSPAGGNLMWAATAPDHDGDDRLAVGVVLHQKPGTGSENGLRAVLATSRSLIASVRHWVATTTPGTTR